MWRITGIFLFMCGALVTHLAQQDWHILTTPLPTPATQSASAVEAQSATEAVNTPQTIPQILSEMSLEEKVGQLLMVGHWSKNSYQYTENLILQYGIGGIIIMDVGTSVDATVPVWTKNWQAKSPLPLLISIDQEGGVVNRIRAPGYTQTSQREVDTDKKAYELGLKRGKELAGLGINTNFAPVLDYASSSDAFLYQRSFASSTTLSSLATALIAGHAANNVLAIPKHFPGHENSPADSHFELPVVDITAAEFPAYVSQFREVLGTNSSGAIMTAHVLFPKLDAVYPTTLSYEILNRQLRRDLSFDGVIITDDMTMAAITDQWTSNEAAVLALAAGADMILFAAEPGASILAQQRIMEAIAEGELTKDRIDQSVTRILTLKQQQGLLP